MMSQSPEQRSTIDCVLTPGQEKKTDNIINVILVFKHLWLIKIKQVRTKLNDGEDKSCVSK